MRTLRFSGFLDLGASLLTVFTLVFLGEAHATGITSLAGLGASPDSFDWSILGPSHTDISTPYSVSSAQGKTGELSSGSGSLSVVYDGIDFTGGFTPGEAILYTNYVSTDITLTFASPVSGVGAQLEANVDGPFTAQITVNGVDTFSEMGTANGNDNSAIFIGWNGPISAISFAITADVAPPLDFLLGTVYVSNPVPETSTWAMMLLGSAGLAYSGYRRAKNVTASGILRRSTRSRPPRRQRPLCAPDWWKPRFHR